MRSRNALILIAFGAISALATAQNNAKTEAPCASAAQVTPRELLGWWRAEVEGQPPGATLLLEPNPNWAGSLAGTLNRNGQRARVAGDVDEGEFTLEESADGVRIAATWLGDVVEGSCGREIRGTWQAEGSQAARAFVLRKQ